IVRLPLAKTESQPLEHPRPEPAEARGKRLLVVDDNVDGADALGRLLSLMGQRTATAYDGQSALQCAANFVPEVVLLDLGMPGMDGFEVCRLLREQMGKTGRRPKI